MYLQDDKGSKSLVAIEDEQAYLGMEYVVSYLNRSVSLPIADGRCLSLLLTQPQSASELQRLAGVDEDVTKVIISRNKETITAAIISENDAELFAKLPQDYQAIAMNPIRASTIREKILCSFVKKTPGGAQSFSTTDEGLMGQFESAASKPRRVFQKHLSQVRKELPPSLMQRTLDSKKKLKEYMERARNGETDPLFAALEDQIAVLKAAEASELPDQTLLAAYSHLKGSVDIPLPETVFRNNMFRPVMDALVPRETLEFQSENITASRISHPKQFADLVVKPENEGGPSSPPDPEQDSKPKKRDSEDEDHTFPDDGKKSKLLEKENPLIIL